MAETKVDRDRVLEMWKAGVQVRQIAALFDVSTQRIYQLLDDFERERKIRRRR